MNTLGALFSILTVAGVLLLPRRWVLLPMMACVLWMTAGQVLMIGTADFTPLRLVIAAGFVRVVLRSETLAGGMLPVDWLVLCWGVLLVAAGVFHLPGTVTYHAGIVWTEVGAYFLFRHFVRDREDVLRALRLMIAMMIPVAGMLLHEKSGGDNLLASFGGVNPAALLRGGTLRASGPFAHPILAGTAGAACIAFGIAVIGRYRLAGVGGCAAGVSIVYASGSSGPALMAAFFLLGLLCWSLRERMGTVRLLIVVGLVLLAMVMKAPIWYLMGRVDVMGGSEGWFRAQLIQSSIEHFSEWWLIGTDVTHHWMATGIAANDRHTDITNHYLGVAVRGGLLLLLIFVAVIVLSFRNAGRALKIESLTPDPHTFLPWTLGALLLGYVMNFLAIRVYDQSVILFWFTIAALAALAIRSRAANTEVEPRRHAEPERPLSPYLTAARGGPLRSPSRQ